MRLLKSLSILAILSGTAVWAEDASQAGSTVTATQDNTQSMSDYLVFIGSLKETLENIERSYATTAQDLNDRKSAMEEALYALEIDAINFKVTKTTSERLATTELADMLGEGLKLSPSSVSILKHKLLDAYDNGGINNVIGTLKGEFKVMQLDPFIQSLVKDFEEYHRLSANNWYDQN